MPADPNATLRQGTDPPHYVVITAGTLGDLYPLLGLASALKRRGRRVTVVGPTAHLEATRPTGLPYIGLGTAEQFKQVLEHPDLWDPKKGLDVIWQFMSLATEHFEKTMAEWPVSPRCVMVTHPLLLHLAAVVRAERPDWRIASVFLAPSNLRTCHDPLTMGPLRIPRWVPHGVRRWLWRLIDRRLLDPVAVPRINHIRQAHGLPPVTGYVEHLLTAGDLTVTLFPDWFGPRLPDWPEPLQAGAFPLFDPGADAPLPAPLAQFLDAGDAPIVFTPGSGFRRGGPYFEQALQAAQRLGRRAVFVTPHRDQVPASLPDSVFWQPGVPFRTLLPRAAALVHHGGIGTTAEALHAGVPQLVVPRAFDQFDNAMRVASLGVGQVLEAKRLSASALHRALQRLLGTDGIRLQALALRERFGDIAHGLDGVCARIEAL
jgi:rhamnosyltransferase subunit B